ncbi:MAG: hypothetical protein KBG11_01340 [Bacteroidia bacterium]|nr:hypothetical protein [Bacteroidia bacterium]
MQFLKITALFIFISATFVACKKDFEGEPNNAGAPETYMVVDSIFRSGDTRYTTTVEAHWWGSVTSGFIKGYEVSIDNMLTWSFTDKQSGTFLLNLPAGSDTADIRIFVRAINDKDVADPTPASTSYPVRNTAPTAKFDYSFGQKSASFPAFRYNWKLQDIDGINDISTLEIGFNDTTANVITLPASVLAATFVAEQLNGSFTGNFSIYTNSQTNPITQKISGGIFNDTNTIFIRCKDRTGAISAWDNSKIFIRKPKNGLLFINDNTDNKNEVTNFYARRIINLQGNYANFDTVISFVDIFPTDEFTTIKTFEFFNKIIWVSEDPTRSLGTAQNATIPFFNNGGKMFLILEIPNDVALDAPFFSFTPIEKLVDNPGRSFRMTTGDQVYPYNNTWPTLKATGIVTYPRPFYTYTSSSGLYKYDSLARADLRSFGSGGSPPWTGPSNIMAKRINTQLNKTDIVTITAPLRLLNGNNNIDSFFNKVVISELEF